MWKCGGCFLVMLYFQLITVTYKRIFNIWKSNKILKNFLYLYMESNSKVPVFKK